MTEHVITICKIGQGFNCCKYLVVGSDGFECMKINQANKKIIDSNWGAQKSAQSDNCEGKKQSALNLKK
jgi:hypothetical protein